MPDLAEVILVAMLQVLKALLLQLLLEMVEQAELQEREEQVLLEAPMLEELLAQVEHFLELFQFVDLKQNTSEVFPCYKEGAEHLEAEAADQIKQSLDAAALVAVVAQAVVY